MSSHVVDPNSVQSQFVNLNRDREVLRQTAQNAERERRREDITLQNLRETHNALTEKLRVAHAKLGEENKKRHLLVDEERRHKRAMAEDKSSLLELNDRLKRMVEEERVQKKNFVKEMTLLNDELDRALRQNEEKKIMKYVTVNNLQFFIDTKVKNEMVKEKEFAPPTAEMTTEGGGGGGADDDTTATDTSKMLHDEKWHSLYEKMNESLDMLKDASAKLQSEEKARARLEEERCSLRALMINEGHATDNTGQPLGEQELDELERLWDEAYESETDEAIINEKEHSSERARNNTDSYHHQFSQHHEESQQSHQKAQDDQRQQHNPINMELFYGNGNGCDEGLGDNGSDIMTMSESSFQQPFSDKILV